MPLTGILQPTGDWDEWRALVLDSISELRKVADGLKTSFAELHEEVTGICKQAAAMTSLEARLHSVEADITRELMPAVVSIKRTRVMIWSIVAPVAVSIVVGILALAWAIIRQHL